jgi:hypothetical protein
MIQLDVRSTHDNPDQREHWQVMQQLKRMLK